MKTAIRFFRPTCPRPNFTWMRCRWLAHGGIVLLVAGVLGLPAVVRGEAVTREKADARAQAPAQDRGTAAAPGRINVFVYFAEGANRGPVRAFAQQKGGFVKYEYKRALPDAINVRNIPVDAVAALSNQPNSVSLNGVLSRN